MRTKNTICDLGKLLRDRHIGRILVETNSTPRTAGYLANKQGIPIALCFKRLNLMVEHGLLEKTLIQKQENGRDIFAYRSTLAIGHSFVEDGMVRAALIL